MQLLQTVGEGIIAVVLGSLHFESHTSCVTIVPWLMSDDHHACNHTECCSGFDIRKFAWTASFSQYCCGWRVQLAHWQGQQDGVFHDREELHSFPELYVYMIVDIILSFSISSLCLWYIRFFFSLTNEKKLNTMLTRISKEPSYCRKLREQRDVLAQMKHYGLGHSVESLEYWLTTPLF